MIYLDSSVILAHILTGPRRPPAAIWAETLFSSNLAAYEVWNRVHAYGLTGSHGPTTQNLLDRIDLVELTPGVLGRALEPFPVPVRTLDALHLATLEFLRARDPRRLLLATYDARMIRAAQALNFDLFPL